MVRELRPWRRLEIGGESAGSTITALQRQFNRMVDDLFAGFDGDRLTSLFGERSFHPPLEVLEEDQAVVVTAELPGMGHDDIELVLTDAGLTLRGEKRSQRSDEVSGRRVTERLYGYFERTVPIGVAIDEDGIDASFKDGVLTVRLPKQPSAVSQSKKISIRNA